MKDIFDLGLPVEGQNVMIFLSTTILQSVVGLVSDKQGRWMNYSVSKSEGIYMEEEGYEICNFGTGKDCTEYGNGSE